MNRASELQETGSRIEKKYTKALFPRHLR